MDYSKDVGEIRNQVLLVATSTVARVYQLKGLKVGKLICNLNASETIIEHHNEGRRDNFLQKMSTPGNFLDPHQEAKQINRVNFSKVIAEKMLTLYQNQAIHSLTIISDSKMLGDLRLSLNKELLSLVHTEIVENLSHFDTHAIEEHLTAFHKCKQN